MILTQQHLRTRLHVKGADALLTVTGRDRRRHAAGARMLAEQRRQRRLHAAAAPAVRRRLELRTRRLRHALRVLAD
jgi:hypothetical protein